MAKATLLNKGRFTREESKDDHDYEISPSSLHSMVTSLIPGLSGVSGGRVMLGDKSFLQAISVPKREVPLVSSWAGENETFNEQLGKEVGAVHAKHAGTVTKVTDDYISIGDKKHEIYNNFQLGAKTALHHTPVVKVGDKVEKGGLLATSNFTNDKGHLALGVNLRTAVMPYRGMNFEDAIVITESGAKKMQAEQTHRLRISRKFGVETSKDKYVSLFPNKYTNQQLSHLDADGMAKEGTVLHYGDPYVLSMSPRTLRTTDMNLGKIAKALANAYQDNTHTWDYENPGTVARVAKTDDQVTLQIKTVRPVDVGSKLSNFAGSKGVVTMVPDSQAPRDKDGKPVDLILNSMSITSRVAPALLNVMALGKVAEKTGKHYKLKPFNKKSLEEFAREEMAKHGVVDREELYDPVTGRNIHATVGPLYTTRLVHIAEDKVSDRSQGVGYTADMQPGKVEGESSKRIGNLGTTALLSHGAEHFLRDIALTRATNDPIFWRHLKMGLPPPPLKSPFIFDKFIASLRGAGVNVDRKHGIMQVLPQTDKDVAKLSQGEIKEPSTFKIKDNNLEPEEGGLFDPSKVGATGGNFNHIAITEEIPNPVCEEYLRKLLKVTGDQYQELVSDGQIATKVKALDLNKEISDKRAYLKSGKKTDRDNALKLLSFLENLKRQNISLPDLLIKKIPIIPAKFRPVSLMGNLALTADVNHLYKELILINRALTKTEHLPEAKLKELRQARYNAVGAIYGLEDPTSTKLVDKNIKGLLASTLGVHGSSAKVSMFQSKVVNKPMDLVGRTVLVPDATLDLDQASIPSDILWKVYQPFVIRNLVRRGLKVMRAEELTRNHNPLAEVALHEEMATRPAVITRDPQLHKYSSQGFYLKPNSDQKDKTLKMNPLLFKGLGADSDGDQLNIQVPASYEAIQEVIDKMLPSKNLIGPATFGPMFVPSNESSLGLHQLNSEDNKNKPKEFANEAAVLKAWNKGEVEPGDHVIIKN